MEKQLDIDVLYIHPTKALTNMLYSIMPVGIVGILNMLIEQGCKVKGINIGVEKSIKHNYDITSDFKKYNYKILLIDLHWYEHAFGALQVAELSKKINPNVPVIIGGMTSTIFSSEILRNFPCIDYIVKSDGEIPLSMLVEYILKQSCQLKDIPNICYRDKDTIVDKDIINCCPSLDKLNFTSIDFLKNSNFYYYATTNGLSKIDNKNFWLPIARGCIYNCSYCCGSNKNSKKLFGRNNIIVRNVESIAKDIQKLSEKGVEIVSPTHDFQMFGKDFYSKLFSLLRTSTVKIGLYLECFQLPSFDFLIDIKNTFNLARTTIAISPLTGEENLRVKNGKNFSNDSLYRLLDFATKNNITIHLFYSMNIIGENKDTFNSTINQLEYISKTYPLHLLKFCCQGVVLDPLAPSRDNTSNVKCELNTFMDYYNYCKKDMKFYVGYQDPILEDLYSRQSRYDSFVRNTIDSYNKTHIKEFSFL